MKQLKPLPFFLIVILLIITSLARSVTLNLLVNPGFETGSLRNWTVLDSCRFELYDLVKHSGRRSLAFFPLKEGAGIRSDISSIIRPGYRYLVTGWFRNARVGWGQVDVLLLYQQAGQARQTLVGRADCNKDIWTQLANQFSVPEQAERSGLQLVIKTAWGQNAFLVDDLELRPALQIRIDRQTSGAYWPKVAEWGKLPGPARFKATAGLANQLYLNLENIRTLQVQIPKSPFDPGKELKISVNGKVFITMNAPLPDSIFVTEDNGSWCAKTDWSDRPSFVMHTPGGVHNLYHQEPLLIVYGTGGDETAQQAMAQAAVAASKSVHPLWVGDEGDIKDGVPNHQLLYGHLKMKPDTAVTESDLKKYHLVLIGKAEENQLVQKMQNQLPVQFGKEIVCSDGVRLPSQNVVMGLYYYNPLAPEKLIYWVAADNPSAYRPYNFLFQLQSDNPCGTDLLVVQENPPKIIKVRHFDSRWSWSHAFENSAKVAEHENTFGKVFERLAEAIRTATGSDFALQAVQALPELQAGLPGVTQWADFAALDFTTPIAVMQMKGNLILSHQKGFAARGSQLRFYPAAGDKIKPEKIYQVALPASYSEIQQLINLQNYVPDGFEILDMTVFEAMERKLF